MKINERVWKMIEEADRQNKPAVNQTHQGINKTRIKTVLAQLDLSHDNLIDTIFALLDNSRPSWFSKPPQKATFSSGATTAHIGCHVGILQRRKGKLDREGRDHWIKPLRDLGIIERIWLDSKTREFQLHGNPKSPNLAYRLKFEFITILHANEENWLKLFEDWCAKEIIRKRKQAQAQTSSVIHQITAHSDLIGKTIEFYVPRFLPKYKLLYIDDGNGDRITETEKDKLFEAGLILTLDDARPDILLWNPKTDHLWVIEAVISDGEVDNQKVQQLKAFANRYGKSGVGFTTAYITWKTAARRQKRYRNIFPGTYIWIFEDSSKHFLVKSF